MTYFLESSVSVRFIFMPRNGRYPKTGTPHGPGIPGIRRLYHEYNEKNIIKKNISQ